MNNLTFLQKIKTFILSHKFWSSVGLIILVVLVYILFFKNSSSAETRYVTSSVSKGNVVSYVSGTGQIKASDTIDLKSKTSGEITYLGVKAGDTVNKGKLIASIDSRDARLALENAKITLEKLVGDPDSLTLLQRQNALEKLYSDGWNNTSSFITDADNIVVGLEDLHNGYLGYQNKMLLSKTGKDKIEASSSAYWSAKKSLDDTKQLYRSLTQSSSDEEIEKLLSNTSLTSKNISNAVKLAQASYDYTYNYLDQASSTEATTAQKNLISWTSTINSYVNSIVSNLNNIKESKLSLSDIIDGADDLDIRSAKLSVENKQAAYNDCFIYAPFDGVIATLTAKEGETPSGSIGTLITKQKIATISLNEVDIAKIKLDQKVTLSFDAISDLTLTGKVAEIDSVGTVSSGVVSYNVSISLDVDDVRIKPGMSVSASIITDTARDVLVVPSSAVKTKNGASYVEKFSATLPAAASRATGSPSSILPSQTQVVVGLSDDTNTEIISGLKEGDIVVTKTVTGSTSSSKSSTPSLLNSMMPGGNRNSVYKSSTTTIKSGTSKTSTSSGIGAGAPPMD